jgi:radical SAM superfamily enzyme YgiQ (UPF0313 family)
MKILLINPTTINIIGTNLPKALQEKGDSVPPLGLMYLAGYLEKYTDYEVKILDCQIENIDYEQLGEKIKQENPDVVGITTTTFTLIDAIKTAGIVKKTNPKIKIVLGGPHVHIYPEESVRIKEIDYCVLGEGEMPFKDLLDNLSDVKKLYNIKGIVFKDNNRIVNTGPRDVIENLDSLPFPARHLTPYKKYFSVISSNAPITTMFTSRGCPYKCLFCDRPHLGKNFRARSAKNVVDEMEECAKMGIKEIFIYDDTFGADRQRVLDICSEIKKRNINIAWDIRTRVNTVDEEILRALKEAGCQRIHYGVEAGTQKILNALRKGITLEQAENAFKLTKKMGIQTLAYFMIGSPTETKEDILATIKFMKKINPDYAHIAITTPFPSTDLYRMILEEKIITHDVWKKFAEDPNPEFIPFILEKNLSRKELFSLIKKAYYAFYFRPSYIIKKVLQLKSFKEFIAKTKAMIALLKM